MDEADSRNLLRSRLEEAGARIRLSTEITILQDKLRVLRAENKALRESNESLRSSALQEREASVKFERENTALRAENAKLKEEVDWLGMKPTARDKERDRVRAALAFSMENEEAYTKATGASSRVIRDLLDAVRRRAGLEGE